MNLDNVDTGRDIPNDLNVIVEIPAQSAPVKYEINKHNGAMYVDRFTGTSMHYPCNYGYIPHTLSDDGDPADVLVITPVPLISGSVVRSRPIGMLKMRDEAGEDCKILAVPIDKLTSMYAKIDTPRDFPPLMLDQISHFFAHYKDLEAGKWVSIDGWVGPEEAKQEILASVERYQAAPEKPLF